MNHYRNILDSWITIEQLSEGSINKKDRTYQQLYEAQSDWKQFFEEYIQNKMSNRKFQKAGIVMYIGIFDFQDVVDILKKQYKIPDTKDTYEEISKSDKFTMALYFDNELNFIADKLFLTMSGYIRAKGYIPDNFNEIENVFKETLSRNFEEDFHKAFDELYHKYEISHENFRYKFLTDIENGDVNLHSFFIGDLKKAKSLDNEDLNRYIKGFSGNRINLDSHKDSKNFNPTIFEEILQPKNYPLGRFPTDTNYPLSFMQQVAVNLALNNENNILSVNGPPGTGKTTLLKDIFAELIVQQAAEIVFNNVKIEPTIVYWQKAKFGVLPRSIAEKNIVVASSNNGAVQNIVNELPKCEKISKEFIEELKAVDYFTYISNCSLEKTFENNEVQIEMTKINDENWGAFSLEAGKAVNIEKLMSTIESIIRDLGDNYEPSATVYTEFKEAYNNLKKEREEMQKICEKVYRLRKLKTQLEELEITQNREIQEKKNILRDFVDRNNAEINTLQMEINDYNVKSKDIENQMEQIVLNRKQAERNYEIIVAQKPSLLSIQKIFFKSKVEKYLNNWTLANEEIQNLITQKNELSEQMQKINLLIEEKTNLIQKLKANIKKQEEEFQNWKNHIESKVSKLKEEINQIKQEVSLENIESVDFSISYEDLQNSNPWFTKEFRILQSKLFILALKVRKQFLYENVKNLKAASIIWNKQSGYIEKENGQEIISAAWNWINFAIPVVSTTFASFSRMFNNVEERSIGYLFIDEAGQALPQASVGAYFRSNKVMVVGDPSQIKPVLTLDSKVLTLIGRHYKVDEKYVSAEASTQTLTDDASQFGFYKSEEEWVGIPLWVHRRCKDPMFTIANTISYNGLMVLGKERINDKEKRYGKGFWIDVSGKANDKYVQQQGMVLKDLILEKISNDPELAKEIYVISPFKNVAYQLTKLLDQIKFPIREEDKVTNIGTVHTFQGKEAKIVYLVLGADDGSKGAASWAVSEPNILNVAATRAKEEFYVIGDKKLYASLGSKVANDTISIIEEYNMNTKSDC